jgi:PAS domain S-box-containing protein
VVSPKLPDVADARQLRSLIDVLANQLRPAVDGHFDFTVRVDVRDEAIEKLQTLINFVLDAARRAVAELEARQQLLEREIAQRTQTEELLRTSRHKYRTLVDHLPQRVFVKDKNLVYVSCNNNYARDLGVAPAEVVSKTDYDFYPSELAEKYRADDRRILGSGNTEDIEETYLAGGREALVHTVKTPVRDVNGKINGVLGIFWDVTEQKRAQRVLAETVRHQAELNRLQQALLGPGELTDKLTKIATAGIQLFEMDFCRIWVTKPGDRCHSGCIHAAATEGPHVCKHRDRCLHLVASAGRYTHTNGKVHRRVPFGCYKIGRLASGVDHKFLTNDVVTDPRVHNHEWAKELGLVSFAGYQLRPPGGETIGVLAMFSKHVITPEVDAMLEHLANTAARVILSAQADNEHGALQTQLMQAQRLESVGQLAAGIAHEINTPTQFVSDNARFLQTAFPKLADLLARYGELLSACRSGAVSAALLDELEAATKKAKLDYLLSQIPEALSDSLEGLERVTKIVRAMKDFAHPGQQSMAPADLNKAIESTVTVARNEWKYVADMQLELDPALPPVPCLLADFNQVILNIVVNAAHAIKDVVGDGSGGKGQITITTRQDGDQAEVRIRDTGTGIPEEHRDRIFDPFFTTKEVGKGTGQGLAIARQVIVEKHGGTLTFETEVGRGTTFIVRLPLQLDADAPNEATQNELAHAPRR